MTPSSPRALPVKGCSVKILGGQVMCETLSQLQATCFEREVWKVQPFCFSVLANPNQRYLTGPNTYFNCWLVFINPQHIFCCRPCWSQDETVSFRLTELSNGHSCQLSNPDQTCLLTVEACILSTSVHWAENMSRQVLPLLLVLCKTCRKQVGKRKHQEKYMRFLKYWSPPGTCQFWHMLTDGPSGQVPC